MARLESKTKDTQAREAADLHEGDPTERPGSPAAPGGQREDRDHDRKAGLTRDAQSPRETLERDRERDEWTRSRGIAGGGAPSAVTSGPITPSSGVEPEKVPDRAGRFQGPPEMERAIPVRDRPTSPSELAERIRELMHDITPAERRDKAADLLLDYVNDDEVRIAFKAHPRF